MRKKILFSILMLIICFPVAESQAGGQKTMVVNAVDGNTLIVKRDRKTVMVRLWGINAPALSQPFGREAKARLMVLCRNQKVTVYLKSGSRKNAYEVYMEKGFRLNLNREMVKKGYARATEAKYKSAEDLARKNKRGLWAQK
jgi:micrococcal nuclease